MPFCGSLIGALIGFMVGSLVARLLETQTEVIEAGHRERRAVLILAMLLVVLGITRWAEQGRLHHGPFDRQWRGPFSR